MPRVNRAALGQGLESLLRDLRPRFAHLVVLTEWDLKDG